MKTSLRFESPPLEKRSPLIYRSRPLVWANIASAINAIWVNRLRSLLTILGIIIGVMAVIIAVTLTQGAGALLNDRIAALGTRTLFIDPGAVQAGGASGGSEQALTLADVRTIHELQNVQYVTPVLTVGAQLIAGSNNWNTRVQGVYPQVQEIQNWQLARGSWFSTDSAELERPVAVLGDTVATELFGRAGVNPVGQTVLMRNQVFRVVGVLRAKGALGAYNQDDIVFVPFRAATMRLKNTRYLDQILVQVDSAEHVHAVENAIRTTLRSTHHLLLKQEDDFMIRSPHELLQTAQQFAQIFMVLLVGIAAVSLTVGGIGIMNIMLVSVTERTREIGIRIAVGARRSDIRNQFLIEAMMLSISGGMLGIILGLYGGWLITNTFHLPFLLNPFPILLAFSTAAGIGILFGLYPALRASHLNPIVALRSD